MATIRELLDAVLQEGLQLDDEIVITIVDNNDNIIESQVVTTSVEAYSRRKMVEIKIIPESLPENTQEETEQSDLSKE